MNFWRRSPRPLESWLSSSSNSATSLARTPRDTDRAGKKEKEERGEERGGVGNRVKQGQRGEKAGEEQIFLRA